MKLYPRFPLPVCLRSFGLKAGLRMWTMDFKLGWKINGWRTLFCP